ncbi:unnamed protein product [Citrullus colocynthis]|uniref:Uncharacterized protein n=1 Tax=Citrullus colocynthis TaxID=252529 RepID=A0ABP0YJ52_9ROSI
MFLRRGFAFASPQFVWRACSFCSKALPKGSRGSKNERVAHSDSIVNGSSRPQISPLFPDGKPYSAAYDVELVDDDTWEVSCGLARAWEGREKGWSGLDNRYFLEDEAHDPVDYCDSDFDDIDNMRIRGNLFYKLDQGSKEFEEYSLDFHRKKKSTKEKEDMQNSRSKVNDKLTKCLASGHVKLPEHVKNKYVIVERENDDVEKKLRTPTFNQLTGPYHEPFCLDIYISKASVRACVIHRVTSKVVAVAHSISKDMKFDLTSRKDSSACAAVGAVLAQRALADDIYNLVYTPRKGERIEGKLQIVLQSVIDNGINVKIKMASSSESERKEPVNEQMVANMYGALRSELNQIYSKITELEMEVSEHSLVISAIEPLDPSRRCYRMIGGVLVERTIKEVLPAVQRNKEGLEEVISRLNEALEKKKKEISDLEAKYKIRIRKPDGEAKQEDAGRKEGAAQGVLVGPAGES